MKMANSNTEYNRIVHGTTPINGNNQNFVTNMENFLCHNLCEKWCLILLHKL